MMNQDLLKKLFAEEPLSVDEIAQLDIALDAQHDAMRACVGGLADSDPSLSWRSTLNERILKMTPVATPDMESVDLDVKLASATQAEAARWVQSLPEEVPAMAWRSELNEKLLALRPAPRRKPFWSAWKIAGAGAFACAGAVAVAMLFTPRASAPIETASITENTIEAKLIAAHQESTGAIDLGASNLRPTEQRSGNQLWNDADLETL
jgi:hypothetical protein